MSKEVKFLVDKNALDKVFVYLQGKPYVEVVDIINILSTNIQKNVELKEKGVLENEVKDKEVK